jgi:hypothetical protein
MTQYGIEKVLLFESKQRQIRITRTVPKGARPTLNICNKIERRLF